MAEIIHCPKCSKPLQVPENFFGHTVQCPECRHTFTAVSESVSPLPPVTPAASPTASPAYDDDLYDDDRRRRRDPYDDDELGRRDRFDDDDYRYHEFGRGRPNRSSFVSHRAGLIMAIGLVSLAGGLSCGLPAILGPVAWAMASHDLREMHEGRMDPTGEGLTRAGQICGIIGTIVLGLVFLYFAALVMMSMGGGF